MSEYRVRRIWVTHPTFLCPVLESSEQPELLELIPPRQGLRTLLGKGDYAIRFQIFIVRGSSTFLKIERKCYQQMV